jgi:hypothetical protein
VLLNVQQALKPETIQQLTSQEETKPRRSDVSNNACRSVKVD